MTTTRLLLHSITYYWRTNLAVLLGVVAGTAVIGGALIVGDSVRGSLRQMTFDRLGNIDHVVSSHRFFSEDLAASIKQQPEFNTRFENIAPALVMPGSLTREDQEKQETHRSNRVNVFGVGEAMWNMVDHGAAALPADDAVVLSRNVADELRAKQGDQLTLWIELPSSIPRDTLLGERDEDAVEITLTVAAILDENSGAGRLGLNPNQQLPSNAFVSLSSLQSALNLSATRTRDRVARKIITTPARVNSLFASAKMADDAHGTTAEAAADDLTRMLSQSLTLDDLQLRITQNEKFGYLSLESEQQILETQLAAAGERTAKNLGLQQSPVMIYLANELTNADNNLADYDKKTGYSLYSAVAGLDFASLEDEAKSWEGEAPAEPRGQPRDQPSAQQELRPPKKDDAPNPFWPFEFDGPPPTKPLGEGDIKTGGPGEIILNEWLAEDLQAKVGQTVELKYHVVGSHGELPEEVRKFKVHGIVKLDDTPAADGGLVPTVKGITDAESLADWEQPFPMKTQLITGRDELYWEDYKATPKAFVTLETAQFLWKSRYGQLTSLRVTPLDGKSLEESATAFGQELLSQLDPRALALSFQPVKFQGVQAASGTTDFTGLFIGFSFFLILSATILIGLLFRLGIERRSTNIGLLSAVGFTPRGTRRMFLTEGLIVVVAGGLIGVVAAVGYASLMVHGLKTWWYGAIGTRFLDVYVTPQSLGAGFGISVFVAAIAIWWAMRQLRGLSTRELLSGATEQSLTAAAQKSRGKRGTRVGMVSVVLSLLLIAGAITGLIPASEAFSGFSWQTVAFFIVGTALLTASLAFLSSWLDSDKSAAVRGSGLLGMGRLGMRNAARHRQRSVLTTGLIASATFVIVAVAAGHRNPASETPDKSSGNGGFLLVAETTTPILASLTTIEGRRELGLLFNEDAVNPEDQLAAKRKNQLLEQLQVMPFRVKPGEEASCLNIYQTRLPKILGVPPAMIERGGFKFIGAGQENPWTLLTEQLEPTVVEEPSQQELPTIPVFGDMNTLQYSLHKGVGDTIIGPTAENPQYVLKIVGQFDGSVFQGVLLMSEENFRSLYPERAGYEYFLVDSTGINSWLEQRIEKAQTELRRLRSRPTREVLPNPEADAVAEEVNALMSIRSNLPQRLSDILETSLTDYGFDTERVSVRLTRFLSVQNTYLSTFQTLGGLGLLLGTLGLATVMLRNVLERRSELALLRAVGFRNNSLGWLVLWENAFLLTWGLLAGTGSALLAMLPHLRSIGADVPWTSVELILAGVFIVGMLAAFIAVREAIRTPILATLRSE